MRQVVFNPGCGIAVLIDVTQNVAIAFTGNPVPPVTGTGATVSMNSQRFNFSAVPASASRS